MVLTLVYLRSSNGEVYAGDKKSYGDPSSVVIFESPRFGTDVEPLRTLVNILCPRTRGGFWLF